MKGEEQERERERTGEQWKGSLVRKHEEAEKRQHQRTQ